MLAAISAHTPFPLNDIWTTKSKGNSRKGCHTWGGRGGLP